MKQGTGERKQQQIMKRIPVVTLGSMLLLSGILCRAHAAAPGPLNASAVLGETPILAAAGVLAAVAAWPVWRAAAARRSPQRQEPAQPPL